MTEQGQRYTAGGHQLDADVARPAWRPACFASDALAKASSLGHHRAGEEHLLLTLLDGRADDPARRAFAAAGVTYEDVASGLRAQLDRFGPPVPRKHSGTISDLSLHSVVGRAEGLALGLGSTTPGTEHALLALLWQVAGTADHLISDAGSSRRAVFTAAAEFGLGPGTPPPDVATANPLLGPAGRQAAHLGHRFISPDHLMLALFDGDPDDVAGQTLRACGLSHDAWDCRTTGDGTKPPDDDVPAVEPNPAAWELLARAEGLALASGRTTPGSQHGLLAFLWSPEGRATSSLERDETTVATVLTALRSLDVTVPAAQLPRPNAPRSKGPRSPSRSTGLTTSSPR